MEESSFSQNGTVYGFPASFYGQADGYPVSTNLPLQEQPEFPTMVAPRRNPRTLTTFAYVATLCSIVCFSMAFGVYKNRTITIGMGSSVLLQPNRFFVEKINVEQPFKKTVGPILYGFNKKPHLDHMSSWSDAHSASLQSNSHKGWMYFLNEGSQINITYTVVRSSKLLLTIRRVFIELQVHTQSVNQVFHLYCIAISFVMMDTAMVTVMVIVMLQTNAWMISQVQVPFSPGTPFKLYLFFVQIGNGVIQENILQSGNYYIAVENLNRDVEEVCWKPVFIAQPIPLTYASEQVELNISGRGLVYDTDEAYYMCNLAQGRCVFDVLLLKENHVVLSTPQFTQIPS
ncbi:E3 ubiquitin-protein ligase APD1-like [Bidens hawaiensis]|uniref:E3 ubiquitin-protein ligase APD1-like n=1 Tax=Bidens hawaiensis TaxID=980011 RepID=UPI00404B54FD